MPALSRATEGPIHQPWSLSGNCASAPAIRAREVLELKPPARKVEQQLFAGEAPAVT
ncbi:MULTISPECIES: hypothetical protein [unclassified Streptomyces]|uniref:hypothetical protein n=1 Tax=unclassified Streptomyces TaxID=2593676 RepID=UPI00380B65AE